MSTREKEADLTKAEDSVPSHLELEDEKHGPHIDDDTHKPEDKPLLSHEESFLYQEDVLQETRVNNPEDKDLQNVPIKKEDEGRDSDSDTDDNVKVTIGNINTGPSIYMCVTLSLLGLGDIRGGERQ
ncbi:testis-specific protein TSX-like [Lepus europaeus]|uniref:testis-specific protein TSX-like n=1 Tax=Lepus europaeus TaxID=9983 RepID=UPI002B48F72B|nr:testis-specific protein TSX-like [Lepus europaeus]